MVPLSGLAGNGIDQLMKAVLRSTRRGTGASRPRSSTNGSSEAIEANPPPAVSGRRIKIRYMTQVKRARRISPLFGNQLDALPKSYTRYLVNSIREAFDLPGTPIRVSLRMGEEPVRQGAEVEHSPPCHPRRP